MAMVAEIVEVIAPANANAGDAVLVDVRVKNQGQSPGGYSYIAVTGVYDSTPLSWQFDYLEVAPQETVVFRGWFTMPSQKVKVTLSSWYWNGNQWVADDSRQFDIDLAGVAPAPAFDEFRILDYGRA